MNKFRFLVIVLLFVSCSSSEKLHTEQYKGKEILVGKAQRSDFSKKPYNEWFDANYRDCYPDASVIEALKSHINNYRFAVVLGTWCPDSQEQVPVFFKVLDQAGYKQEPVIYCVPRHYKDYKPVKKYNIIRVPTFIVYENNKEIGRIIEYPMENIEADLLKIMTSKDYRHELNE